jgi:hypothetical protein
MPTLLTADTDFASFNVGQRTEYIAATGAIWYAGSLMMLNASGLAVPVPTTASDNSSYRVIGQAIRSVTTPATGAVAGEIVVVRHDLNFEVNAGVALAQTLVGTLVYASSDNEATTVTQYNPKLGVLLSAGAAGAKVKIAHSIMTPA